MTDFNSVQKETINLWRQSRGFGILEMPDDKAVSIMLKEMESSGVVYAGFEGLVKKSGSSATNNSPSVFGWGNENERS